jgi:hypothetical protein
MAVAGINGRWETFGLFLALTMWLALSAVSGWFIIQRKRWAWVGGTILSFNILVWIINYIYGRNRWGEFVGEPYNSAEDVPPAQSVGTQANGDTGQARPVAVAKPKSGLSRWRMRNLATGLTVAIVVILGLTAVWVWPDRKLVRAKPRLLTDAEVGLPNFGPVLDRRAAEQGHAEAQSQLGWCYYSGQGVPQDYVEAVKWYRKAAEQGDANAQRSLGSCYENGQGVPKWCAEAVNWYRKAADQGDQSAQFSLGECFSEGKGVWQDYAEAVNWYRKASEQGLAIAQCKLGLCYEDGKGVGQDQGEAVKWFRKAAQQGSAWGQWLCWLMCDDRAEAVGWLRKAANQGDPRAQSEIGRYYYSGEGVPKDYGEAAKWFRKAAEQGDAKAQSTLGVCYTIGQGVPKDAGEAVKWYRKAADQGEVSAQYNLGACYAEGQGVPQDYAEVVKWYLNAADQGDQFAQWFLGRCYDNGEGVQQDYAEAAKWYRKAADQGLDLAQGSLGMCYYNGEGVRRDYAEAVKWYRKAAEQGDSDAQGPLGMCYYNGEGVRRDYAEAVKWYRMAADQGDPGAQCNLGFCYEKGTGVAKDLVGAVKWFRKAAEQGYAVAQRNLGICYSKGNGVPQNDIEAYKWLSLAAAQGQEGSAEARDSFAQRMVRAEVVEGQRRAAAFVAKKEGGGSGSGDISPTPEIAEGKRCVGTGFFVTDDGYFVTCEHVVRGATSFHVRSPSGSLPARLIKKDRTIDVAVLKVDGAFRALPVAAQPRVKLGEAVFTVGFPNPGLQGVEPKLTRGEISSMAGVRDNPRYFQVSVPVQPGNSGGALLDECGNAVGVVTSRLDDVATYEESGALPQNVNYAVKGGLVYSFLNGVPELSGKLKAPRTGKDREAASGAAERAAVLVTAE